MFPVATRRSAFIAGASLSALIYLLGELKARRHRLRDEFLLQKWSNHDSREPRGQSVWPLKSYSHGASEVIEVLPDRPIAECATRLTDESLGIGQYPIERFKTEGSSAGDFGGVDRHGEIEPLQIRGELVVSK